MAERHAHEEEIKILLNMRAEPWLEMLSSFFQTESQMDLQDLLQRVYMKGVGDAMREL